MSFNYGIDISKWQGEWRDPQATVDSGVDFVYMRAGNGFRKDTRVEEYAYIAKERGLNFGVYHFFRPKLDPVKQADFLYELHNKLGANMIPQLDIEHSDDLPADKVTHAVHLYIERARELFGVVSVYSAAWWCWGESTKQRARRSPTGAGKRLWISWGHSARARQRFASGIPMPRRCWSWAGFWKLGPWRRHCSSRAGPIPIFSSSVESTVSPEVMGSSASPV